MTYTAEQLRLVIAAMEAGEPMDHSKAIELASAHADALEENARLRSRLEVDPRHSIDGIAARDETIRLLEERLAAERERADRNQEDAERYRWLKVNDNAYLLAEDIIDTAMGK